MARTRVLHYLAALLLAPTIANADSLKVIGVNFIKMQHKPTILALRGRGIIDLGLDNKGITYVAHIGVGTPPQQVAVQLDTGSNDLWVPLASSDVCTVREHACDLYGACKSDALLQISSAGS